MDSGYFSYKGRIDRETFLLLYFIPNLIALVLLGAALVPLFFLYFVGIGLAAESACGPAFPAVLAVFGLTVVYMIGQAKRFHDCSMSGWLTLINLAPAGYLIGLILSVISEGDKGSNFYGPPPRKS